MELAGGLVAGMTFTLFGVMILAKGIKDIYEAGHIHDLTYVDDLEAQGVFFAMLGLAVAVAGAFVGVING